MLNATWPDAIWGQPTTSAASPAESRQSDTTVRMRKLDRVDALEATRPVHLPTAGEESHPGQRCCA